MHRLARHRKLGGDRGLVIVIAVHIDRKVEPREHLDVAVVGEARRTRAEEMNVKFAASSSPPLARDGVDRCEALCRLRHEQPKLYRALQADVRTARNGLAPGPF